MVLPLAPAYGPEYHAVDGLHQEERARSTPFEAYLRNRQHDRAPRAPQSLVTVSARALRHQVEPVNQHASPRVAECLGASQTSGPSTARVAPAESSQQQQQQQQQHPSQQHHASTSGSAPGTMEYGTLIDAAAGLAAVARCLAAKPSPTPSQEATAVQASFHALASAAHDLAVNVAVQRATTAQQKPPPPRPRPGPAAPPTPTTALAAAAAAQVAALQHHQQQHSHAPGRPPMPPPTPSRPAAPFPALDPVAEATAAQASAAAPFASPGAASAPVVPPGRTSTPKFHPVSPLVALAAACALPTPPRTAAAACGQQAPGTPLRPSTANPITHSLQDPAGPGPRSALSSAGAHAGYGRPPPGRGLLGTPPGPGDQGSTIAQVLTLPAHGEGGGSTAASPAPPAGGAAGAGAALLGPGDVVDPVEFYLSNPDLVRVDRWPPLTPITGAQVQGDRMARQINSMLVSLRDRIAALGEARVLRYFKLLDLDGSGHLDAREFRGVLAKLNLSCSSDQVLDVILAGMDANQDGRVAYGEFVSAIKANRLPWQRYNAKFRHRVLGDPEQPFGAPGVEFPYGTMRDGELNNRAAKARVDDTFSDLRRMFQVADQRGTGRVDREQFVAVMHALDRQQRLNLGDDYILRLFRDLDLDFCGTVDWQQFLAAFEAGVPNSRFVPEFLLPQSLRCSQLGAPWEWHTSPQPGMNRTGALAPPLTAPGGKGGLVPSTTSRGSTTRTSIRVYPHPGGPPATPLVLPGSRLLRSLQ